MAKFKKGDIAYTHKLNPVGIHNFLILDYRVPEFEYLIRYEDNPKQRPYWVSMSTVDQYYYTKTELVLYGKI